MQNLIMLFQITLTSHTQFPEFSFFYMKQNKIEGSPTEVSQKIQQFLFPNYFFQCVAAIFSQISSNIIKQSLEQMKVKQLDSESYETPTLPFPA